MTSDEISRLQQALRDERTERDRAQSRVTELEGKIATWRDRAEERAERIATLETEREQLRSPVGWMRARMGRSLRASPGARRTTPPDRAESPASRSELGRPGRSPSFPAIRAAVASSDPHLHMVMSETDAVRFDSVVPSDADAVVVDQATLSGRADVASAIDSWVALDARVPLIVFTDDAGYADPRADVVAQPSDVLTFDPALVNPATRERLDPHEAVLGREPVGEEIHLIRAALEIDVDGLDRGITARAVRERRVAFEQRSPSAIAANLLQRAGVRVPDRPVRVAGLLVSMRQDNVIGAIDRFAAQAHADRELVVVCHGFDASAARRHLEAASVEGRVLAVGSDAALGTCLNLAATETSAPILAKIDDDDHYGPGYLTDAVQALEYSGSDLVGKATQFTYLESEDQTVLRRVGTEECVIDGSVAGGSMVFRRSLWEDVRFADRPRRVDALFLRGARALGALVYATSRWDFVYVRHGTDQTWRADDAMFSGAAERAWDGRQFDRANA